MRKIAIALAAAAWLSPRGISRAADLEWTSPNQYRVLLTVEARRAPRSNSPATVDIDFSRMLGELGGRGTFDDRTIEVVAYDPSGRPCVFDASGRVNERYLLPWGVQRYYGVSRVTLSFVMPDHTCARYAVYFDTAESGRAEPRRYPGPVGDGDWFREGHQKREIAVSKMDDLCDLDNDGDLDLFAVTVEPFIYCYENVGGSRLVDRGRLTSGGEPFVLPHDRNNRSWAVLRFDDWDSDGDQDLFVGFTSGEAAYQYQFVAYENVTPAGGLLRFQERGPLKTISGKPVGSFWFATMAIVDWDGDGRKDVLASHLIEPTYGPLKEYHRILFYKNTGGQGWAFNLADGVVLKADGQEIESHAPRVECGDLDGDGDSEIFCAAQNGQVCWYRNIGTRTEAVLTAAGTIATVGGHAGVKVADFTGDGLPDCLVGDLWGGGPEPDRPRAHARLYRNAGTRVEPRFEEVDTDHGAPYTEGFQSCYVGRQNALRAVDWNNDGRTDLIAGSEKGSVTYYENLGNHLRPIFAPPRRLVTDAGPAARSDVCDWNNDGRNDLLVANMRGELRLHLNEGTDADPKLAPGKRVEANGKPIDGTHWGNVLVCDWDNDGRKDVVFGMGGEGESSTHYDWPHLDPQDPSQDRGFLFYRNEGTDAEPVLASPMWIKGGGVVISHTRPNVGSYVDWDGDGKKDFIACEFENIVRLYRNTGSGQPNAEPQLAAGVIILRPWTVQMISTAHAMDWNRDGDLDIVTGQGHGGTGLRFFERDYIDDVLNNTHPTVTAQKAEAASARASR